ncbi:Aspartate--tRNA ligase 2, cytoplasmic [Arachis hypogaea]|nr:Aspartate--tRNA ligase 2, cytoplasmic [Arachis hypogaea]
MLLEVKLKLRRHFRLVSGEQLVRVNQDTRLNFRAFRQFLLSGGSVEIHTPKLIAGSSEGGAAVFRLGYKGHPACLIQSPQLHRQMAICAYFGRVFEISPAFRAEDSFTHRHLCEFPGLDVEMEIKKHYYEIMDKVDRLFVSIFDSLNQNCKKALEAYLCQTLRLTYEEGVQMLKGASLMLRLPLYFPLIDGSWFSVFCSKGCFIDAEASPLFFLL